MKMRGVKIQSALNARKNVIPKKLVWGFKSTYTIRAAILRETISASAHILSCGAIIFVSKKVRHCDCIQI